MERWKRKQVLFASIAWLGHALDLVGPGLDPPVDSLGPASLMRRSGTATRVAPRVRRGRLHLAPARRGRRRHDRLEGAGRPPEVAPARDPCRALARARRRGHPSRVLARVRAAEARAHRGRAEESPRRAASGSRRPRRLHRRDLRLLARDRVRPARRRGGGARDGAPEGNQAEDPVPHGPDREPAQQSLLAYALATRRTPATRSSSHGSTSAATSPKPGRTRRSSAALRTTSAARSRAGRSRRACRSSRSRRRWDTRTRGCWSGFTAGRPPSSCRSWLARWGSRPLTPALSPGRCRGRGGSLRVRRPAEPKNSEARQTSQSTRPLMLELGSVVPGGGIEPPTRGFSVPCSTD